MRTEPPFRADHVGSLLRPPALLRAREAHAVGEIEVGQLRAAEDAAIREAVAMQERVGLRAATDGEFRRTSWHMDFIHRLGGIEKTDERIEVRMHGEAGDTSFTAAGIAVRSRVRLDGPIFADDFVFLQQAVTTALPKLTIPSPSMVHYRGGTAAVDRTVYPDMEEFWADLSSTYADEVRALGDLGCRYLQLDDISLAYLNDPAQRAAMSARGEDADEAHLRYIAQINAALAGRPEGMRVTTHMCRGNYRSSWAAEGGYDFVAEALFGELGVDGFFCEFDDERSGGFAPLRFVPPGKQVVLGLVTTKRGALEDADVLKRRIDEAAKYVPLDQLCLSPQCGFSSTVEGNTLTYDEQVAKLELIVRVAEDVWGLSVGPAGWGDPLYAHALDAADVGPGTSLLDLGCGTGEFARLATARGARVVGVDTDPAAVALAAEAVPRGRFGVGDAHDLGPVDALGGPFAVVAAMQLLTHVANPLKVLREAARVAVRGGTLVASVWGHEKESDVRVFGEALAPWLPPRRPASGPPRLTDPDHLRRVAWLAGLAVVGVDEVVCPFDYPDEEAVLDPLLASGIGRAAVLSATRRGAGARAGEQVVRRAVQERLGAFRVAGGGYRLQNLFRVLVARCPE